MGWVALKAGRIPGGNWRREFVAFYPDGGMRISARAAESLGLKRFVRNGKIVVLFFLNEDAKELAMVPLDLDREPEALEEDLADGYAGKQREDGSFSFTVSSLNTLLREKGLVPKTGTVRFDAKWSLEQDMVVMSLSGASKK